MQRKLVSVQTLRLLLNLELATFESCQGVAVQAIDVLTTADSDGCNWTVQTYSVHLPSGGQCRALIEGTLHAMRWRYNIGREHRKTANAEMRATPVIESRSA